MEKRTRESYRRVLVMREQENITEGTNNLGEATSLSPDVMLKMKTNSSIQLHANATLLPFPHIMWRDQMSAFEWI